MYKRLIISIGSLAAVALPVVQTISCSSDDRYLHAYIEIDTNKFVRGDWFTFEKEVQKAYGSLDGTIDKGVKLIVRKDGANFGEELVLDKKYFVVSIPGMSNVELGEEGVQAKIDWEYRVFDQLNESLPLPEFPMDSARQTLVQIGTGLFKNEESRFIKFISNTDIKIDTTTAEFINTNAPVKTRIMARSTNDVTETTKTIIANSYIRVFSVLPGITESGLYITPDDVNKITRIGYGELREFDLIEPSTTDEIITLVYDSNGNYIGHTKLSKDQFTSLYPSIQIN